MVENQLWRNSFQEAFKSLDQLYSYLGWDKETHFPAEKDFSLFIPKRLADKIKRLGPNSALAREFLPHSDEVNSTIQFKGLVDPIGDKKYLKAPQLIHRYRTRALFTPTSICPVHCRYCFRRNELQVSEDLFQKDFELTLDYLKNHPEISEIIFTGGDPLTLSNEKIENYLESFSKIESIKDIRFHSRYPVIMPERIDDGFLGLLNFYGAKFRTLSLAIHANHIDEFDDVAVKKILSLSKTPVQLLSQTVLLKGVNNSADELVQLINIFLELKIRPYYLHHPDQVKGGLHFYLSLKDGRRIYAQLRDQLPGWAIPHYVIDIPQGPGKVNAFNPENYEFSGQLIGKNGIANTHKEPDLFSI